MELKFKKRIPAWMMNRYFITIIAFLVWISFFDKNDLITQYGYRSELSKLEADRDYFIREIAQSQRDLNDLMSDPEHLEKYAREHYFMKKDNEDLFIVETMTETE